MIEKPLATLEWLARGIPFGLVGSASLERALAAAGALPPVQGLCLECRLGPDPRVDLIAAVTPAWGRSELLSATTSSAGWGPVRTLCQAWADPRDALHEQVPCLWLEFDLHATAEAMPGPFTTCCVQPDIHRGALHGGVTAAGTRVRAAAERVGAILAGASLSARTASSMAACFDALPEHGTVMHVAGRAARGQAGVRLAMALPKTQLGRYLEDIGWEGDFSQLPALLDLVEFSSRVEIYLDIDEHVLPQLGCASMILKTQADPRLGLLLDRLVNAGLCMPEKRDAAAGWVRSDEVTLPGNAWPSSILRYLSLKLVTRPGETLEAKAYLEAYAPFTLLCEPSGSCQPEWTPSALRV